MWIHHDGSSERRITRGTLPSILLRDLGLGYPPWEFISMGEEPPSCTEGGRLRAERCLHLDSVEWQACVDACISTHEGAGEPYPPSRRSSMGSMGRTHPVQTDPPVQEHPRSTEEEPPINGPCHQPFPFDGVFEIASSIAAGARGSASRTTRSCRSDRVRRETCIQDRSRRPSNGRGAPERTSDGAFRARKDLH